MPLIQIKLIEGVFDTDQKQEMIERVTDAMVSVEGENMRPLTWVLVQEDVKSGDWGIGGQALTTAVRRYCTGERTKAPASRSSGFSSRPCRSPTTSTCHGSRRRPPA